MQSVYIFFILTYTFVKNVISIDYTNEEYSYGVLQEKEIETIGLNIKYNFFKQCESFYSKYNMLKISDIEANKQVRTMGIIKKIKEIETKGGKVDIKKIKKGAYRDTPEYLINYEIKGLNDIRNEHSGYFTGRHNFKWSCIQL